MKDQNDFVFQSDSDIVRHFYQADKNYIIEFDEDHDNNICVLYFSSNNIYETNTEEGFGDSIVKKNKYEWYKTRIIKARKHIFLRDLLKQWYLTGINSTYNSPELLYEFLKKETNGYHVISIGSSSGGFAAVLYGSLLKAIRIVSFNGQFEVFSLLSTSNSAVNPILFRNRNIIILTQYYEVSKFITNPSNIFYFFSTRSTWDKEQFEYIRLKGINSTGFLTSHHGIPFLKCNLSRILSLTNESLLKMNKKIYHPLFFSLKMVGLVKTIRGLYAQLRKH